MSKKCLNYLVFGERELVLLLKSGDLMAYEQLYHNYKIRLYRAVFNIVKTEHHAAELLTEVFASIWAARADIDQDKPFRDILYKTAEDLICNFFRRAALNKKIEDRFIAAAINTGNGKENYCNPDSTPLFRSVYELTTHDKNQIDVLNDGGHRVYRQVVQPPSTSQGINRRFVKASQKIRNLFRVAMG